MPLAVALPCFEGCLEAKPALTLPPLSRLGLGR
jgi:hypothetical protein